MSEVIHVQATVERDGKVHVANLPVKRGQRVELSIRIDAAEEAPYGLTAGDLLATDLVCMWAGRTDIGDSVAYARELREQAQRRER